MAHETGMLASAANFNLFSAATAACCVESFTAARKGSRGRRSRRGREVREASRTIRAAEAFRQQDKVAYTFPSCQEEFLRTARNLCPLRAAFCNSTQLGTVGGG